MSVTAATVDSHATFPFANVPMVMADNRFARVLEYSSLSTALTVWLLSLPRLGIVPSVLGCTPTWMFAMLLAGCLLGAIAVLRNNGWWVAVAVSGFTMLLMLC